MMKIRDHMSLMGLLRSGEAHPFVPNIKLNAESCRSLAILMVISTFQLLRLGEAHPFVALTKLNSESYRSLAILMLISTFQLLRLRLGKARSFVASTNLNTQASPSLAILMLFVNKCVKTSLTATVLASSMKIESLPEDLLENIFSRISLKSRTRLKCVSKSWCAFLNRLRKSLPQPTSFSIVLESSPFATYDFQTLISATVLSFEDQATKCLLRTSFQLPKLFYQPNMFTSCNGLLLYYVESRHCDFLFFEDLYIVNPMLHQCRVLPRLENLTSEPALWFLGMSFFTEQHFKVILNTDGIRPGDKTTIFYIFESDKWEWKKHYARVISDVPYFSLCMPFCSFSWKEKIYFLYLADMAIYNVEQGVLKFVKLPTNGMKPDPEKREFFWPFEEHGEVCPSFEETGILWVSEGTLYYCVSDTNYVFRIWSYDDVNDKWRSKTRFPRAGNKLKLRHMDLALHTVQLIGFNDDLQILYIKVCQIIVAYSFETKRLTRVWGQIFSVDNNKLTWQRGHPFVSNPVSLFTGEDQ